MRDSINYHAEDGKPDIFVHKTTKKGLGSRSDDYEWRETSFFGIEGSLSEDDIDHVFNIEYLIEILTTLNNEIDSDFVKVRMSEKGAIHFLTKDNAHKIMSSLARLNPDGLDAGRFDPIEANLLGYHVICHERNDGCDWKHDRYPSERRAIEAAEAHRYYTGHDCKIRDYNGNTVHESLKSDQGDTGGE